MVSSNQSSLPYGVEVIKSISKFRYFAIFNYQNTVYLFVITFRHHKGSLQYLHNSNDLAYTYAKYIIFTNGEINKRRFSNSSPGFYDKCLHIHLRPPRPSPPPSPPPPLPTTTTTPTSTPTTTNTHHHHHQHQHHYHSYQHQQQHQQQQQLCTTKQYNTACIFFPGDKSMTCLITYTIWPEYSTPVSRYVTWPYFLH